MEKKNNIRSIRFSDTMIEMIEQQVGENFTKKFEALVTRCMWELPKREQELARIEELIDRRKSELRELGAKVEKYKNTMRNIDYNLSALDRTMAAEIKRYTE